MANIPAAGGRGGGAGGGGSGNDGSNTTGENPEWHSRGQRIVANIGGVKLRGHVTDSQSGGVNAPEHKTERGYEWRTRSGAEAVTASMDGWTTQLGVFLLAELRGRKTPFPFVSTVVSLPRVVLTNLDVTSEGNTPGAINVSVEVKEVQQAQSSSGSVQAIGATGTKSSSAGGGPGGGGNSGGGATNVSTSRSQAAISATGGGGDINVNRSPAAQSATGGGGNL